MSDKDLHDPNGVGTTGHEWDGIQEFNNPLPRWWLWIFYATIVWGVIYVILYPAWPLVNSATQGVLGWNSRAVGQAEIAAAAERNAPLNDRLVALEELSELPADADLNRFAIAKGASVFRTNCSQCHGAGAAGVQASGYPNLRDDDWLWGGDMDNIYLTVAHGIRNEQSDEARYSEMPAFGEILEEEEISQVVHHVLNISGQEHDAALATAGAVIYEEQCSACHLENGQGDRDQGAPNLTDAIWLYGGSEEAIRETVHYSRFGVMPAWNDRLTEAQLRAVTAYVHSLGGGE